MFTLNHYDKSEYFKWLLSFYSQHINSGSRNSRELEPPVKKLGCENTPVLTHFQNENHSFVHSEIFFTFFVSCTYVVSILTNVKVKSNKMRLFSSGSFANMKYIEITKIIYLSKMVKMSRDTHVK